MESFILEIYRPGRVYSEGCLFQLKSEQPFQTFKTGDRVNVRSLVDVTSIADIEPGNQSLRVVGIEHLIWTHDSDKVSHQIMVFTLPDPDSRGSSVKVMKPISTEKNALELYRSDREKPVVQLSKKQPFPALNQGDLINLRTLAGVEYEVEKGLLRVEEIEHVIWLNNENLSCHQIRAFTEPVPDRHETAEKFFS